MISTRSKISGRPAAMICMVLLALGGGVGCPPTTMPPSSQPVGPPREMDEVIAAIAQNERLLDKALWSSSVQVAAHFSDENGKEHVYHLESNFLYRRPRDLRMDLRPGLGEQVMQIGSNAEEYWIWIDPELHRMWWGRHRYVGKSCTKKIAVRSDHLIAALGMGGLPKAADGLIGPARKYGSRFDILYYVRRRANQSYQLAREYWISRMPPYQIVGVKIRDRLGRVSMSALLDDYGPAWEGGAQIAHTISIIWPQSGDKFTLWLGKTRGVTEIKPGAFHRPTADRLPAGIAGRIIQVDAACDHLSEDAGADDGSGD